ncbi:hypothetical protein C8P64_1523 [Christiangramia gaetbulicola]|uniref:Lipocalin-like protein n=1 Tax=Christiangramia gaetbulicola TaxID=703340 RepID=A0A2T6AGR5_9FLAO|nr:hypothetical protein [Christiangramia gaetbulicola]PTX42999.1 hypothetical protein C8P64_1523 [Christiangramia gaetbulicola]
MKRFKIVLVLLMVSLLLSCDTDQDDISISEAEAKELSLITQNGEWKISKFTINEIENTANYSDYVFVFEEGNNLTAFGSIDEVSGTWRVSNDSGDEFDPYDDVDFHIFFSSQGKLGELANNYDVIAATNSEIRLIMEQNGNGDTASLTFSKN